VWKCWIASVFAIPKTRKTINILGPVWCRNHFLCLIRRQGNKKGVKMYQCMYACMEGAHWREQMSFKWSADSTGIRKVPLLYRNVKVRDWSKTFQLLPDFAVYVYVPSTVQCDHIGRFFASWAIVYFGQFFYYRSSPNFWTVFRRESFVGIIFLRKNGPGYILSDFFTKSSGHPDFAALQQVLFLASLGGANLAECRVGPSYL
jgi:hypothetical protein